MVQSRSKYCGELTQDVPGAIGMNILLTLCAILIVNSISMICGVYVTPWHFIMAFTTSQILCIRLYNRSTYAKAAAITAMLWVSSVVFATWLADSNYDGVHHHQDMVLYMIDNSSGYNYFSFNRPMEGMDLWVVTHPLGMESIGAPLSAMTGNLESAKAPMMMFFVGTMMLSWEILRVVRPQWSTARRMATLAVLILNPVVMQAVVWLKDDAPLYYVSLLTLIFSYYIVYGRNRLEGYIGLVAVIIISVSMKVNHFFFEGLFILAILAGMRIFHRQTTFKGYLVCSIVAFLFATVIVNFHPYVTNLSIYGHPLYPFFGEGCVDSGNLMPSEYAGGNRLSNFIYSYFTWTRFRSVNHMNEGGILMPLIAVLTSVMIVIYQVRIGKFTRYSYALLVIFAASMIFPQGWRMRYVCFVWLAVAVAYFLWVDKKSWIARLSCRMLLALSIMNGLLYLIISLYSCLSLTAYRRATAETLRNEVCMVSGLSPSAEYQLRHVGIFPLPAYQRPDSSSIIEYYPGDTIHFPYLIVSPAQKCKIDSLTGAAAQVRAWNAGLEIYHRIAD